MSITRSRGRAVSNGRLVGGNSRDAESPKCQLSFVGGQFAANNADPTTSAGTVYPNKLERLFRM